MDIIQVIEIKYASMGKKEKKIAEYAMKNASDLKNMTIHELAEQLSIAASTITRFCQRLGCDNFVDFKIQLHASQEPRKISAGTLHEFVTAYYDEVIDRTAKLISEAKINEVVSEILKANRILIYGIGSSGLSAEEFRMRLVRMGLQAWSESDAHMIIMGSTMTQENDFVIGLSNSGETPEIIEALSNAKKNASKTLAMTSSLSSSLDKTPVDLHLYLHNKQFLNDAYFMNSQITALYIIDLITMKLLENPKLKANIQSTYDRILDSKR